MNKRDKELLDMLAEECAEVIQIIQKINRHGMDSYHPETEEYNRPALVRELLDVTAVIDQVSLHITGDIKISDVNATWRKKLQYTYHQEVAL